MVIHLLADLTPEGALLLCEAMMSNTMGSMLKPNRMLSARLFYGGLPAESRESLQKMRDERPVLEKVDSALLTASAVSGARVCLKEDDTVALPSLGWFGAASVDVPWCKVVSMWKTYRRSECSSERASFRTRQWQRYFVDMWPDCENTPRFRYNVLSLYGSELRSGSIMSLQHGKQKLTMVNVDNMSSDSQLSRQTRPRGHIRVRPWDNSEADVWVSKDQQVRPVCLQLNTM